MTTTKCYRLAIELNQGIGIVEWGIGGDLPFPEENTGAIKGYDADNQAVSLVLDSSSGRFYQIGIKEIWQDKIGSYGRGVDINTMIRLKEHTSVDSEESMVEHIESRINSRPYDENYKGQSGYTSAGFLENHRTNLKMFVNGDTDTPVGTLKSVSQYGDYVYGKRIENKRLQLQIETSTAAFKHTKIRQLIQNINKVTPDNIGGQRTENLYQRMFIGQDLWITRDSKKPLMNRYDGEDANGNYASLTTGPDGKSNSAITLDDGNSINLTLPSVSHPSTVSFWVSDIVGDGIKIEFDNLSIEIENDGGVDTIIKYNLSPIGNVAFEWSGIGWVLVTVSCDGVDFFVYENGVLKGIVPVPVGFTTYGGDTIIEASEMCSVYDIRRIPRQVLSDAVQWYYDDVVNNEGNGGLLPIMR